VVDPAVLAERRAQRAEQGEQSAARRAADAQVLAAQLARERARLEAERDAARAEAAAAREGADAAIAEARHLQAERDTLREALIQARRERDARDAQREAPPTAANGAGRNGHAAPPSAWAAGLRCELAIARTAAVVAVPAAAAASGGPSTVVPGLARERRLVAQRAATGPVLAAKLAPDAEGERRGERAAPITALALERERSSRLQAQLDSSLAVQRELRTHIAALQRAIHQRVEAERRIEAALRRVREELTAANTFAAGRTAAATRPIAPAPAADAPAPAERPVAPAASPAPPALDPVRLSAARERLRAAVPPSDADERPDALPAGTSVPWIAAALQQLLATEPETAGRIAVGLFPAYGLAAERPLRADLLLAGRGCLAVDIVPGAAATVARRAAPRPRGARDLSITGDAVGLARLLYGRRALLRRPARVRGGRKALRELRRLARAPIGLRELGSAGVALDPALALALVALAIDPAATQGERFAVAHAPLAGGPIDAWLRIVDGAPPTVVTQTPSEPTRLTLRCTRGALLALIAGVDPPPGEAGSIDGDPAAITLLRTWIARTEHPAA
jgi:hypothetical protein